MPFQTFSSGTVFAVLWHKAELQDVDAVLEQTRAYYQLQKKPLSLIAIIHSDTPTPEEPVRKRMSSTMESLMQMAKSLHYVTLGTGFTRARILSMIVTVLMNFRHGGKISTHTTLREATTEAKKYDPDINVDTFVTQCERALKVAARV